MAISLKIVGIFFGCTVDFTNGLTEQTIADVLATASADANSGKITDVSSFNYETSNPPNRSLISVSATYTAEVHGRGVEGAYPPGEYSLTEDLSDRPAYSVWQYYVYDASNTPIIRGVKYLDDPAATVPEGGTVIFRLVSILAGPNPRSKIVASRQA
ncbi:hypothetical protein [Sphingomonas sp. BK036]|uniref:hypothetical protein n=1 Tax=Sphingomonas sp. BK036 TaxID=2512122 RepID=UPI001028B937|nr:hypothetical protein [Sphingomonas sp. BK036]